MKKIIIILMILLLFTTSCYAVSIIDKIMYKQFFLNLIKRIVLVHRITGEVKYILTDQGDWVLLLGAQKNQYQSMYNFQTNSK